MQLEPLLERTDCTGAARHAVDLHTCLAIRGKAGSGVVRKLTKRVKSTDSLAHQTSSCCMVYNTDARTNLRDRGQTLSSEGKLC